MIKANGGVYVVNPDGILFGPSSNINVGSFLGTTHDIANSDFMAGRGNFTISGNPSASIVNQGMITAANSGFAALVAPGVRNDGIITARLGTIALASGNGFTLDLYGDNLITLQPQRRHRRERGRCRNGTDAQEPCAKHRQAQSQWRHGEPHGSRGQASARQRRQLIGAHRSQHRRREKRPRRVRRGDGEARSPPERRCRR